MAELRGWFATALIGAVMIAGCSGNGGVTDDTTPIAAASATPTSGDAPLDVAFTGSVTDGDAPFNYDWDFGDGGSSTSQFPNHTYADAGTYTATFTVTDVDGDTDSASVSVTVTEPNIPDPLAATAVAAPHEGLAPLQVNFQGTAIGGTPPYTYAWDFDDGGTASTAAASHTYAVADTYSALLTVTDSASDTDTYEIVIKVADRDNVVASATATPTSGAAPLLVSFTCSASGGAPPYAYAWDFGDGGSSTNKNPSHTFATAGTYSAVCTVTDSLDATDDAGVEIAVGGANVPTVSATATPTSGQAPLAVHFYSTVTGGDTPYTYAWSFGDGGTADVANPVHTFTAGGNYTAQLTVTDNTDDTATDSVVIHVSADNYPSVSLSASPVSGVAPLAVNFTGAVAGGDAPVTYSWTFGDGASATGGLTKTHTYSTAGTYTATLTATDDDGDVAFDTVEISVGDNSQPVAFIIADTYSGDAPLEVNFEGWVFGGDAPLSYSWSFGDGGTSTLQDPTHTFTAEGVYTVTFVVQDDNGDSDADSVDILVTSGLPDLQITSFVATETDGDIDYEVHVKNAGSTDVGSFWVDLFYDSADAPVVGADYGDDWQQVTSLAAGASTTLTFTRASTPPGSYDSWIMVDTFNDIAESNETNNVDGPETVTVTGTPTTDTLVDEDFEGSWQSAWLLYDDNSDSGDDFWGDSYLTQYHSGSYSAFCAEDGDAVSGYDNDMDAYMEINLDFSGYDWIDFEVWLWYNMEPPAYDYLEIVIDDGVQDPLTLTYYGDNPDNPDWTYVYQNLDDFAGSSDVWVTFHFHSDSSVSGSAGYEGAYIDDILIEGTYFP